MEKILLIGGSGFLGRACLKNLSSYEVSIVGRKPLSDCILSKNHKYYTLDIENTQDVERFLKKDHYSHLIFLAWPLSPPHNAIDHVAFSASSIHFLTKFACNNPRARIVFTGSIHEVGKNDGYINNDFENASPKNLYGISKKYVYDCMQVLSSDIHKHISFCWLRLSNIYGVGDHSNKLLINLIFSAMENKIICLNNPNTVVDFVHIKDAAQGICSALLSDCQGIFNIGGGKGYFLRDVANFINNSMKEETDVSVKLEIPEQKNFEFGPVLNISKSFEMFKYSPHVSIENGIVEWIASLKNELKTNE